MKLRNILAPVVAGAAAVGGLAWWLSRNGGSIESHLAGENRNWRWREFDVNFNVAGEGPPLLLLHALYPGASKEQWENNFSALAKSFKVFAPDLPGFGLSSRPAMKYDRSIYKDMIMDFLQDVVEEPAIVLAGGQTAPFVIEVAAEEPKLISRLVLASPTGLTRFANPAPLSQRLMYRWWSLPVVGTLTYHWMVSKRGIAGVMKRHTVEDPTLITPSMVAGLYKQSHQPGAKWAPIAMFGGLLNDNVKASYIQLTQPILILWGEMPSYIPVADAKEFLNLNSYAVLKTFPDGRLMPELEHASKFNSHVQLWAEGKLAA